MIEDNDQAVAFINPNETQTISNDSLDEKTKRLTLEEKKELIAQMRELRKQVKLNDSLDDILRWRDEYRCLN